MELEFQAQFMMETADILKEREPISGWRERNKLLPKTANSRRPGGMQTTTVGAETTVDHGEVGVGQIAESFCFFFV